ncbi:MAG: hypothetical protein WBP00_19485 [Saprospiraceae bacterium]
MKEQMGMDKVQPRFEFRTFGQNFDWAVKRMARLSMPVPENLWDRHSDEIYIVSRAITHNNTKIRDGLLDIKTLIETKQGLEKWNPLLKVVFPISVDALRDEIFPALQADMPTFDQNNIHMAAFLEMVHVHPKLVAVRIHKQRSAYLVNNAICETGSVLINGARVETICIESTEMDDILKAINEIGLAGIENINYLQAIKRVIGMIDKPLAN